MGVKEKEGRHIRSDEEGQNVRKGFTTESSRIIGRIHGNKCVIQHQSKNKSSFLLVMSDVEGTVRKPMTRAWHCEISF